MNVSWPKLYGSKSNPVHNMDEYEAVRQEEFIPIPDHDPLPKRATRCWIVTAATLVISVLVVVLTMGITVEKEGTSPMEPLFSVVDRDYFPPSEPVANEVDSGTPGKQIPPSEGCHVENVKVKSSNEYGEYKGPYPYLTKSGNEMIVEPYKSTVLELNGLDCTYVTLLWEVRAADSKIVFSATTTLPTATIFLKYTGKYTVTVSKSDTRKTGRRQGIRSYVFTGTIFCKYVKREIRSLTLEDRKRFMDASIVLWKTDTLTGRQKYGPKYTSINTFVEEHALASNDIRCDAYHEGTGFLTHHLALQNSFDASVRAVDPRVTTPYWDFSIEGEKIYQAEQPPSYIQNISNIYTAEWFGSTDEKDHIVDSAWAHISMPRTSERSVVRPNSYGYVRSYWNNNNDPEVTRHLFDVCGVEPTFKTVPACADHYLVINQGTLGGFQQTSPGKGHGPLHVLTGGVGGECTQGYANYVRKYHDILYANVTDDEIKAAGLEVKKVRRFGDPPRKKMLDRIVMGEYFHIYRSLWRSHMCARDSTPQLLQCPEKCRQDMPVNKCACTVPGLAEGTIDWRDSYNCVVNEDKRKFFDALFTEEMLRDLVVFVGTTPLVEGDMLEAASPADIMFWMIHPAIERMLAAKRLKGVRYFGNMPMTKWDEREEQWLEYSYYTQAAGENPTYPQAYTCKGHAADDSVLPDALPFLKGFAERADANRNGVITNWEFYQAINPNDPLSVDYVFDNFLWDHCHLPVTTTAAAAADADVDEEGLAQALAVANAAAAAKAGNYTDAGME